VRKRRITNGLRIAADAARGSGWLGRSLCSLPRQPPPTFCQPWPCSASPYTGWQNVVNLKRYTQV